MTLRTMNTVLLTAVMSVAVVATQNPTTTPGQVGSKAAAFTLTDSTGKTRSLSDYEGKYVVLEWSNHECPYVVRHYNSGNMQKTQAWAKENEVVWLTIVSSPVNTQGYVTADQANSLIKSKGHKIDAMLFDSNGATGKAYGAKTTPQMVIVDPKGMIAYNGAIDDKRNATLEETASARNHVIEALKELLAGKEVSVKTTQPYGCGIKY